MVEIVPAIARLLVEKNVPSSGVSNVVPQVGHPAPSAIRPVMMPAFSIFSELFFRFLFQRIMIRPISVLCSSVIKKIEIQSKNSWLIPKIARNVSRIILRLSKGPSVKIRLSLEVPLESRFMRKPNSRKLGINPYQKRFSLVARRMPLPAKIKSSNHFLQFME